MSIEAMKQALEALEELDVHASDYDFAPAYEGAKQRRKRAIAALRASIEAAEKQEIDWKDQYEKQKRRAEMWIAKYEKDIGPLEKAAPAAPVQEPDYKDLFEQMCQQYDVLVDELKAAQRQWVGLTDAERGKLILDNVENVTVAEAAMFKTVARAIEAKLREKNGGRA